MNQQKRKDYLHEDKVLRFLDRRLWKRLGKMLLKHPFLLAFSGFGVLISEWIPQWQPHILMKIIDGPLKEKRIDLIFPFVLLLISLVIVGSVLKYFTLLASQILALRIVKKIRTDLFNNLIYYKIDFFKKTPLGRIITRLTNDVDALNTVFSAGIIELISSAMIMIYTVIFMFFIHWKLACVTLILIPLILICTSIFRKKVRNISQLIFKDIAKLNTSIQESLIGLSILQIFEKTKKQLNDFDKTNQLLKSKWLKNISYHASYFPLMQVFTELSLCVSYFFGVYFFFQDSVTIGTMVAFSWYLGLFWRPLREFSEKYTQLQTGLAAAERIFTLLDLKNIQLPNGTLNSISKPIQVTFKNVDFGYDPDVLCLKNISFSVTKGKTLAIVGATGSGKTTIINLCTRLYFANKGEVLFCGENIQNYQAEFLTQKIAFIPQDVFLFSETIAFNISLSTHIDYTKIDKIIDELNIRAFINHFENGLETQISEGSKNLSLGEKQLIAFARALYQNADLLLLDEASSSIDTETESTIQQALEKITKQITTIIIAHRLSTIQKANEILILKKGKLIEQGTHKDLLKQNGMYKKLYELQVLESSKSIRN